MKTSKELQKMLQAITIARQTYMKAVLENLKESGVEYNVLGFEDEDDGLRLTTMTDDCDDTVNIVIDSIRFNNGHVEVHICEEEYKEKDYWLCINYFSYDDMELIYEQIDW